MVHGNTVISTLDHPITLSGDMSGVGNSRHGRGDGSPDLGGAVAMRMAMISTTTGSDVRNAVLVGSVIEVGAVVMRGSAISSGGAMGLVIRSGIENPGRI